MYFTELVYAGAMAQITIDIPDELAQRLAPFEGQFSDLFTRLIANTLLGQPGPTQPETGSSPVQSAALYQEILDFLVSRPTSRQILNFKVSGLVQSRLQALLAQNRQTTLTASECAELDLYEQLDTLMGLLKVRAYADIQGNVQG
jgi:hypothetical protein